ncbi:MAG: phage tail tube protein [Deltaproteobacteria bacterium]|nr:phage tail tube protein [Deltaproteobacteria bacterium]
MAVTAGVRSFSVDGVAMDVLTLNEFTITNEKNEVVEVVAGTPGTRVTSAIPQIDVVVSWRNVSAADYIGSRDRNVQLVTAEGRSFVWPEAVEVGDGNVNAMDGSFHLVFQSQEAKEIV